MSEQRRRGPMGGHGRMMSGEKAKDFKGSMAKLFRYMGRYKFRFILMFIFAVAGTVFSIVGPKILGKATTELFNGLVAKVNGTGEIDFGKIGMILLWTLGLYVLSACFSFVQGFVMSGISNDVTYNLRKDISKKINRLPLNYYESRTNGEILSRITNDVDTLQMSLNQSLTQLITSVTTLIGVFIMMLSINVWMTLAALLILPVSMFIIQTVMKHSQKYFQDQQSYLGKVNGQIEENFGGHNVVRVFNKENDVVEEFEKGVTLLRNKFPNVALTTDIIVGFPGETDEEFNITYNFLEKIKFSKMHIFKYSQRKGTIAAKMKEQISSTVKEQRSNKLIELSNKNEIEFLNKYIGKTLEVLFETKTQSGHIEGHTTNYITVKTKENNYLENTIKNILITKREDLTLIGKQ